MAVGEKKTPEQRQTDALLATAAETLSTTDGGTVDQRIALAHALSAARIAIALESLDHYGLEISTRSTLSVSIPDSITAYTR